MLSTKLNVEQRDPVDLKNHYHPALKLVPELSDESEEFLALASGIKRCGFIRPLLIDGDGRILDDHSRSALRCALRWQLKTVPVQVVPEGTDVHLLIIHSLAHVRHLSKSAIAYLAFPHLEPALAAARARKLEMLKKTPANAVVDSIDYGAKTVEELAKEIGICRDLLFHARQVHEAFKDPKKYTINVRGGADDGSEVERTLRAHFEPRILQAYQGGEHEQNRPMGLGAVLAGIPSIKEGDKSKFGVKASGQLELFTSKALDLMRRFAGWANLKEADRAKHFDQVREQADKLPQDQCEELAKYYGRLAQEFKAAAKAN